MMEFFEIVIIFILAWIPIVYLFRKVNELEEARWAMKAEVEGLHTNISELREKVHAVRNEVENIRTDLQRILNDAKDKRGWFGISASTNLLEHKLSVLEKYLGVIYAPERTEIIPAEYGRLSKYPKEKK